MLPRWSVRAFRRLPVPGPNPPGAWIDFRIAATRKTDDKPGLTKDTVQLYVEKLPTTDSFSFMVDPDMASTQFDYDWFKYYAAPSENLITSSHGGRKYVLLKTDPASIMLSAEEALRVAGSAVKQLRTLRGNPAISIELDEAGGRRLEN